MKWYFDDALLGVIGFPSWFYYGRNAAHDGLVAVTKWAFVGLADIANSYMIKLNASTPASPSMTW